jgi:hypothetical protein
VTDTVGSNVRYLSYGTTKGSGSYANNLVQVFIGSLAVNESAVITIAVAAQQTGATRTSAVALEFAYDPVFQNNTASATVVILPATGVDDNGDAVVPSNITLNDNYPNPFRTSTTISYSIEKSGLIKVVIADVLGREAALIDEGFRASGNYSLTWVAKHQPAGMYLCTLMNGRERVSRAMFLVK